MTVRCLILWLAFNTPALSHPVSLSWALVLIKENHIQVSLKILAEDLYYFHHLQPDPNFDFQSDELIKAAQDHVELIRKSFYLTLEDGEYLELGQIQVNLNSLEENEIINAMDLMKHEIVYSFKFPIETVNINSVTFHQDLDRRGAGIPAVTFLTAYRESINLVSNQEVSSDRPFLLNLTKPTQTYNLRDLTSSYFTIGESGVRHEITVPFRLLKSLIQPSLYPRKTLQQQVRQYFTRTNPIVSNYNLLMPQVSYMRMLVEDPEQANNDPLVYIDLYYPGVTSDGPTTITWEDYPWTILWFPSEIQAIDGVHRHRFSRYSPTFKWQPQLKMGSLE